MPIAITAPAVRRRRGMVARLLAAGVLAASALPFAAGPSTAADFSNATPIALPLPGPPPGCPTSCPSEKASPYPSVIAVSGLSGAVTDVNVTLRNITYQHNGPADADVVLVAPGGKAVMVMSDACGDNDNPYPIANAITLTFDDQAGAPIPADGACGSGTFRPLDDDDDGEFPFHVPDGITDGPSAPASTRPLSDFNGINGNGNWSLYVVDDYPNDPDPAAKAGQIGGGWALQIATAAPATMAPPAPAPTTAVATTQPPPTTAPVPTAAETTTIPGTSNTTLDPLTDLIGPNSTEVATRRTNSSSDDYVDAAPWMAAGVVLLAGAVFAVRALRARRASR